MNAVDSPPGTTRPSSPSSCSGLRTSTASAPRRRSIAACSRKFPCRARTPISMPRILDFGYRRTGAPGQEKRDGDEDKTREAVDDRPEPVVAMLVVLAFAERSEDERHDEEERVRERLADVGPLVREERRRLEDRPGAEDGPARPPEPRSEQDVEEGDDGDDDPVERALVEEPEQAAADGEAGRHVQPESVRPRGAVVDRDSRQDEREADDDRHGRGPVAPARDEIRDEEPQ